MDSLLLGFAWYIVFIISISVHEASHAFAALKFGDDTAYRGGQVSLHPLPHIKREPFGTIVIPLLSYALGGFMMGWASAPYDPIWAARNPKKAAYMGLAGPASNLLLVVIAGVLIHTGIWFGWFYQPDSIVFSTVVEPVTSGIANGSAIMLSLLFSLNCLLFVFNLIPVPPLDGTALVELALDGEPLARYRQLMSNRTICIVGLVIAWKLIGFIYSPIHSIALNILYPGSNYQ